MTELPKGWAWTEIGDLLVSLRNGVFVSRPAQEPPGTPILRISAVRANSVDLSDVRYAPADAANSETFLIEDGDLLFTRYSGNPKYVGACGVVRGLLEPTLHPDKLIRAVVDRRLVEPAFVSFAMNTGASRRAIEARLKTTAGQVGIAGSQLRTVPVPLAPLAEQRKIVAAIEEQFSRVDDAKRSLLSAKRRLEQLVPRLIDGATHGYPTKPLGDLIREPLRNGHSAKRSSTGSVPVFTLTAVTARDFSNRNTKLTDANPRRVEDLWVEPGDIFVERSNTPELVGTAALYTGPSKRAIFPDLLIRVRVESAILPEYAELGLRSTRLRRYFQRIAKGIAGSMPKIDQGAVLAAELPVPPVEDQKRIVAHVEQRVTILDTLTTTTDHALTRSDHLRRAVLERAFSGRLVPPDPNDEPVAELVVRIDGARATNANPRRRQRA